jgi:hypothetical protein
MKNLNPKIVSNQGCGSFEQMVKNVQNYVVQELSKDELKKEILISNKIRKSLETGKS